MIRGVSFKIPQKTSDILWQIFKCIDVKKYSWYNIESQNEVWTDYKGEVFFNTDFYDGENFLQLIQVNHFIVFLKIQAYFGSYDYFDIHTYEEFQNSDCQLLLLIYDCEFVEIFIKEPIISTKIYENALANNYTEVEYITDDNDGRTKMDIL